MNAKPKDHLIFAALFAATNAAMLGGMSLFAKMLGNYFGAIEVTFWRNFASVILLLIWLMAMRNFAFYKTNRPWAHLIRGAIGTIGIALGMYTVSVLSLAETTVLLFTSPLFTVLLSAPLLKEKVGKFRYGAVIIGFIGVGIIAWPIGSIPLLALATGLGWGLGSGMVDVILRWMGKTENSITTTFYFMVFGTIACGLYWPFTQTPISNIPLNEATIVTGIIFGLGATGTLALLSKTQAYRLGEASLIAPIMYTMLIWSLIFDYIFFDHIPGLNVLAGASLIVAANLFILYRENKLKKSPEQCTDLHPS